MNGIIAADSTVVSERDAEDIRGSISANTAKAYSGHIARIDEWLAGRSITDELLRDYIHKLEEDGKSPATCAQAVCAAGFRAKVNGDPTPVGERTTRAVKRIKREHAGRGRGQSAALTAKQVRKMMRAAQERRQLGNGFETWRNAEVRGAEDASMVGLLFQAGLRRAELAALKWGDFSPAEGVDQALLVRVRKSKTNQEGLRADIRLIKGKAAWWVSRLRGLRREDYGDDDLVFRGINLGSINARIKKTAKAAGLKGRITPHSGRIGLATELTRRGASITETMLAGGWKSARMVAHYASGAVAEKGAVAKYL